MMHPEAIIAMSLTSLYGSDVTSRVASTLDLHRHDGLRQREIARAIDAPVANVQQALVALEKRGVITSESHGDYSVYRIDRSGLRYHLVHSLALHDLGWEHLLASLRDDVMAVITFGSVSLGHDADGEGRARGPRSDSDFDILVIGPSDEDSVEAALAPIATQLDRRLDVVVLDLFAFKRRLAAGDAFVANALSTGLVVLGSIPR
jgi:DNA-binding GntR family transcriptional regulator